MAISNQMDNMLAVREVCRILHVHPDTLRRWTEKGAIGLFCNCPYSDRRFESMDNDRYLAEMNKQNNKCSKP